MYVSSVGSAPPPVTSSTVFNIPYGVAINQTGSSLGSLSATIFVADPQNNQVLAFSPGSSTPSMVFSSLPCTISVCAATSPPSPWILNRPTAVAATPEGNIWISDTGNDVVVEVNATSGAVMAFAGVGPNNTAFGGSPPPHPNAGQNPGQFFGPGSLAVSTTGDVYVADAAGDISLAVPAPGAAFRLFCSYGQAQNCPQAANFRVEVFTSAGTFFNSWGSFCSLSSTEGVFISNGTGTITGTIAGTAGTTCDMSVPGASASGDGEFAYVTGIAFDEISFPPTLYVSDADNNRVQKLIVDGTFVLKWGGLPTGSGDGQFNAPGGIATDLLDNSIYVVDVFNDRIQQFDGNGTFFSKGGSKGAFEAQFDEPFGIATVPGGVAQQCFFAGSTTSNLGPLDCRHGLVVSEQGNQKRVQVLAARVDQDKDSITDDVDTAPTTFSNNFAWFTTTGSILDRGDQTFVVYGVDSPSPQDLIRVRTETFGGATPLQISACGTNVTLSFSAGSGSDFHCSTPTVSVEEGPVGFRFVGDDGTVATATLNTGDSLSVDPHTSKITSNAGAIVVVVGGKTVSLSPGQSTFADTTPPVVSCGSADGVWHALDVSIPCAGADSGSGLANPLDGNFALSTSVPAGIETANAATGTRLVCDLAGNCTTAGPIPGNMIDKKPPTINVTTPISGATYSANQAVSAAYTCTDLGSGVATCSGTVPNGSTIDTAPNGVSTPKTFTVNAADKVGNAASQSVGYMVSCHYVSLGISPSTVTGGKPITVAATVQSCTNSSQTVSLQFTLTGPLGPFPSCATNSSTVMFTTPAFTIPAGTSLTKSFQFHIPRTVCPGNFTITSTTLVGGTPVDSTSAQLVVQRHHREDDHDGEPERTDQREGDREPE